MNAGRRQRADSITKAAGNFFQRSKNFIVKTTQTDLFPDLFNRVHLWRIRRNMQKVNVGWDGQPFRSVPRGSIAAQDNPIFFIVPGKLFQKQVHTGCITIRQDQEERLTRQRFDSPTGIAILPDMMTGNRRTHPFFAPTISGLADTAKRL